MNPVEFPYAAGGVRGRHHRVPADEFLRAWQAMQHMDGPAWFAAVPSANRSEMPCFANKTLTRIAIDARHPFSLERLCRMLVPRAYQNTGQALPAFLRANAHILMAGLGVCRPGSRRVLNTVRLTPAASKRLATLAPVTPSARQESESAPDKLEMRRGARRRRKRVRDLRGVEVISTTSRSVVIVSEIRLPTQSGRESATDEYFRELMNSMARHKPSVVAVVFSGRGRIPIPDWFRAWCEAQGIAIQVVPQEKARKVAEEILKRHQPALEGRLSIERVVGGLDRVRQDFARYCSRFDQKTYPNKVYNSMRSQFGAGPSAVSGSHVKEALLWKFGKYGRRGYPSSFDRVARSATTAVSTLPSGAAARKTLEHLEGEILQRGHTRVFISAAFLTHLLHPSEAPIVDQHNFRATKHYLGFPDVEEAPATWADIELIRQFTKAVLEAWRKREPKTVPSEREFDQFLMAFGQSLK